MRKINELIIHCSATPEGKDFTALDIDKWHKDRGFDMIGYHLVVKLDGTYERGRKDEQIGAHCLGHNQNSIGICYIGGLDKNGNPKDTRTEAQKKTLITLVRTYKGRYKGIKVYGHNQFAAKACPCFDAEKEYKNV